MADGYESFDYNRQRARVAAGYKGKTGQFENPSNGPKLTFIEGVAPEVMAMFKPLTSSIGTTVDPWGQRHRS